MTPQELFFARLKLLAAPRVLELGTRGWDGRPPSHHRERVLATCPAAYWVGVDVAAGADLSVVCDAHDLARHFRPTYFDAWLAVWCFEHFRRPWEMPPQLAAVTRPGGLGLVVTHQTFPLHGYPGDYFRFSRDALGELFLERDGWKFLACEHQHPCRVVPLDNEFARGRDWNFAAEAWLVVAACVQRV